MVGAGFSRPIRKMKQLFVALLLLTTAACGGGTPAPTPPNAPTPNAPAPPVFQIPTGVTPLVAAMYQLLPNYIANALAESQADLPRNPHIASFINAKIALLQRPTLAAEIADGRMFAERSVTSIDERRIEIATLFAEERLRGEAMQTLQTVGEALPILERFVDTPFPGTAVRIWYGFKVGASGGGGTITAEDRTTYEARTPATRLPHDSILCHELAHTYMGSEILTQFLELYVYNRLLGSTPDLATWGFTRGYAGMRDDNRDVALVLDVYQMLGHDAMARAYKAAVAVRAPYGQPLSAAVRQAFVDQAPQQFKGAVDAKLSLITF
jgi:hypothetical protein